MCLHRFFLRRVFHQVFNPVPFDCYIAVRLLCLKRNGFPGRSFVNEQQGISVRFGCRTQRQVVSEQVSGFFVDEGAGIDTHSRSVCAIIVRRIHPVRAYGVGERQKQKKRQCRRGTCFFQSFPYLSQINSTIPAYALDSVASSGRKTMRKCCVPGFWPKPDPCTTMTCFWRINSLTKISSLSGISIRG